MTELFQQLMAWIGLHPYWAGAIIFLVAMAESLAVIGLVVPGVVIMFGIGTLISGGAIAFWSAMALAVSGAVAGDGLSFWLGHHYREQLTGTWPFNRYPASLERGITFFQKYGGKSIAIGRFFGPVRAIIPLVAGMMEMQPSRFILANVISALIWAPAYLLPGMVFGASLELASEVALRLVTLILLLAVLIWLAMLIAKWLFRFLHPHTSAWVQGILRWSQLHPSTGEIAAALADPNHPEGRSLSILASLLLLTTVLFAFLLGTVPEGSFFAIDNAILQALQSIRTPWADHLMVYLTRLTDTGTVAALILGILGFLVWRRHWRTVLYWLAAVLFCVLASPLLKMGLQIPRPEVVMHPPGSYSFPSGHTLKAVVLFGFLSVIIARPISVRWRWLAYGVAGLLVAAVSLSRLYLGVHWFSDVLGSIALGLAWVAALGMAYHRHAHVETHWRSLTITAAVILILAFSVETGLHHERNFAQYKPAESLQEIAADGWWERNGSGLPDKRADIRYRYEHPLNVQFAGSLGWLADQLSHSGWQQADLISWKNQLQRLSPGLHLNQLPVLPQVHDGKHESLVLAKSLPDDRRLILRLWPSHIRLSPSEETLWIGNVSEQRQVRVMNMISYAKTTANFEVAFQSLSRDLNGFPAGHISKGRDRLLIRAKVNTSSLLPKSFHTPKP
ncbi:bifunctional DedA family/phosphatase PAP2 family protein [Candidatus Vondammii sp. HM_W22]|uniref:bifunctional DedA family/phosphatase PAP2 family protein n=1 Tax=Candidatus Vondammii sp. HM_W22 TaxID=2687299 RepID=UPI001F13B6E0|nr:bifunctional DedA family/phosphatase PAP2 family protein [Candidatus Vondammii sp. HM_W22]